ncbi:MAG: Hsp20/alpha crystallin family protein [Spirochaetes bacterium]|nr:Hsp20/alpha crystallin family protein [Spirochaetota bacterium]
MNFNLIKSKTNKNELDRTGSGFSDLFEDFFNLTPSSFMQNSWNPAVDLKEDSNGLHLSIEVPGLDEKDLNVVIENNSVTISGEKKESREEKGKEGYYYSERRYGSFSRTISLPEGVNADKAKATYSKGILKIDFPEAQSKKVKKIQIEVK